MVFTYWALFVVAEGIERGYGWEGADSGGVVVCVEVFEPGVAGVSVLFSMATGRERMVR